jgi:hypothetical protein
VEAGRAVAGIVEAALAVDGAATVAGGISPSLTRIVEGGATVVAGIRVETGGTVDGIVDAGKAVD